MPFFVNGVFEPSLFFRGSISTMSNSKRNLLIFSRFARALPPGRGDEKEKALLEHFAIYQTHFVTPKNVLGAIEKDVQNIFKSEQFADIDATTFDASESSCFEKKVKEGGMKGYLRWMYQGFPDPSKPSKIAPRSIENVEFRMTDIHDSIVRNLWPDAPEWDIHKYKYPRQVCPDSNVVVVSDRGGFKVRVVTTSPACLQALAHVVRRQMYDRVLTTTPTKWAILPDGLEKWFEQLPTQEWVDQQRSYGKWVLLSSDLKSATDLLPHDIVESFNDSMERCMPVTKANSPTWAAWRSLSGPQRLHYTFDLIQECFLIKEEKCIVSSRGNLMGTAPSWFHLNIYNLVLFRLAWSFTNRVLSKPYYHKVLKILRKTSVLTDAEEERIKSCISFLTYEYQEKAFPFSVKKSLGRGLNSLTAIMGDDLAAICPLVTARLYKSLLELTGGQASAGKHYVQPYDNESFILIGEKIAVVKDGRIQYLHVGSLRAFANLRASYNSREPNSEWACLGPILETATMDLTPDLRSPILSMAHTITSETRLRLLKFGLPVYLPIIAGGLGWPHPKGLEYAISRVHPKALTAYHVIRGFRNDPVRFVALLAELRTFWSRSEKASETLSMMIERAHQRLSMQEIARDVNGEITTLTEEEPIGLVNPEYAKYSVPLFDYIINKAMRWALCSYYLSPDDVKDRPLLTLSQVANHYVKRRDKIISLRAPGFGVHINAPVTINAIQADQKLLTELHILDVMDYRKALADESRTSTVSDLD